MKTGERADGKFVIEQRWGGVGAGWLLILLGPLGWIVLGCAVGIAVLAAAASRLPLTEVQDVLGAIRGRRASRSAQ